MKMREMVCMSGCCNTLFLVRCVAYKGELILTKAGKSELFLLSSSIYGRLFHCGERWWFKYLAISRRFKGLFLRLQYEIFHIHELRYCISSNKILPTHYLVEFVRSSSNTSCIADGYFYVCNIYWTASGEQVTLAGRERTVMFLRKFVSNGWPGNSVEQLALNFHTSSTYLQCLANKKK